MASEFGVVLRRRRKAARLTQEELAERSGMSVRAIADVESGRTSRPHRRSVQLLADALGLTGPDRAELGAAARRDDSALLLGQAETSRRGQPVQTALVLRQLPAGIPHFAGRSGELGALVGLLGDGSGSAAAATVAAITGMPGVGKTTLAVHWAHQIAERYPDGQLYVDLRGYDPGQPMTPSDALAGFLRALGVAGQDVPAELDEQAARYRSLLAGRRMLVLLDNARDVAQVRPLLPGGPGCLVLVTSRSQLTSLVAVEGAYPLILDVLRPADARELLAGRLGPERITAEPGAVTELTELCARLPLALAIAAARAAIHPGLPIVALVTELRDAAGRLAALDAGDPASSVRAVFSWSYQKLGEPAARMFRLLGVHPGPDITAAAAASLAAVLPGQAREALTQLTRASLLTEHSPGRYAFHDLLRAYAAKQAQVIDSSVDRRAALHRTLDHYLHTASAGSLLLNRNRDRVALDPPQPQVRPEKLADRQQAVEWFRAERQVLLAHIERAVDGKFDRHAWQLPWATATFLNWHGYWRELLATGEPGLAAARQIGDLAGQAEVHRYLSQAQTRLGDRSGASANLSAALARYRQLGNHALQARTHLDLVGAREAEGRGLDALSHAEQALLLYRTSRHRPGECMALNAIGWAHAQLGHYQQALDYCRRALTIARELGNRAVEAAVLDSMGYAHYQLGQHAHAISCYQQAAEAHGDADDKLMRAVLLEHLGDAYHAAGDMGAAYRAWRQALSILDNLHHPDAQRVHARLRESSAG